MSLRAFLMIWCFGALSCKADLERCLESAKGLDDRADCYSQHGYRKTGTGRVSGMLFWRDPKSDSCSALFFENDRATVAGVEFSFEVTDEDRFLTISNKGKTEAVALAVPTPEGFYLSLVKPEKPAQGTSKFFLHWSRADCELKNRAAEQ